MAFPRSPVLAAAGTLTALHAPEPTVWAIRGDREMYCWLSVLSALPVRGGCVPGFWLEQAHADQPPVVIDALDDVAVQLELGDDGGREVNPAGMQLGESDRLVAGLAQSLQQPLLLDVSGRHRRIGPLQQMVGASSVSKPRCWHRTFGDWGFGRRPPLPPPQSTHALCERRH